MERAEEYLEQIPMWTKEKHSLEDIRRMLERLGNPDRGIPAIHVAGTNGKGSVCAFLTSALRQAGLRVGTFLSPHLVDIRERFLIDGSMAAPDQFEESFQTVLAAVRAQETEQQDGCRQREHPAYFEFLFYMAMVLFHRCGVDVMVIETGLGGRLDATNVLEHPLACVITSISLDHTQYLGDTIEKIAAEKAGIIKEGVPVIFDDSNPAASSVIEGTAFCRRAARYPVGRSEFQVEQMTETGIRLCGKLLSGGTIALRIPFEAVYQGENAMLALRTLEVLRQTAPGPFGRITEAALQRGIAEAVWPGRMERAAEGIYLDGAHNPGGIEAFVRTAREISERRGQRAWLLFAAVSDKDYTDMIQQLLNGMEWQEIGVVHMNSSRGLSADCLAKTFEQNGAGGVCPVYAYETAAEAFADMSRRAEGGILFCAGSLYLIGELKRLMRREGSRTND